MKRCPECEFLYEDDQEHCEMDGTRLFFTTTLPPLPAGLKPPKSIWGGFTIPLLAALILGTVIAILYRATPRAYSSSSPVMQSQPANQKTPEANQQSEPPVSDTSEPADNAADESSTADDASKDPFDAKRVKLEKPDNSASDAVEKATAPARATHIETVTNSPVTNAGTTEAKPAESQPTLVNQTSPTGQKSAPASSSVSGHPKPPAWAGSPQPPQNANKDSKINSFFKRAGKVLKKPFDN